MEYVSKYNNINVAEGLSPSRGSGGKKKPPNRRGVNIQNNSSYHLTELGTQLSEPN
jgi:hypothetical protein